ncbi:MAG: 1-acyl-sn-glycerol-3-phosphate acyltransferase [Sulfurospirillum sp.]|nr:1-acyl-sn-glycerol-3-phosphate acyltransferase [Sulfurospirillum sp.]
MFSKIKAIFLIVEFVITVLITIILMYIFPKNTYIIRQKWAKMQSFLMGFSIIQTGQIDPEAKLLLLNHQSLVDIVVLEMIYGKDLCWIAKKEIQDIPLFGHIIRVPKMIAIDRKDKRSIIKIIKEGKQRIGEGRILAMFPEGTRGDGSKLLPFQSGAKMLAQKLNIKVQPIVLTGTREIFDSKTMRAKSGTIRVNFLLHVDPNDDADWFEHCKEDMGRTLTNELAEHTSHR